MPDEIKYDKKGKLYYRREEVFIVTGLLKDCLLGNFVGVEKGFLDWGENVKIFIKDFPKKDDGGIIIPIGRKIKVIIETID